MLAWSDVLLLVPGVGSKDCVHQTQGINSSRILFEDIETKSDTIEDPLGDRVIDFAAQIQFLDASELKGDVLIAACNCLLNDGLIPSS